MNNITMYICSHRKLIPEYIPTNQHYVIAAQNRYVEPVNDLACIYMDDEFTQTHLSWSEVAQYYYIYKHQSLWNEYMGFCHYNRYFKYFYNDLELLPRLLGTNKILCNDQYTHNIPYNVYTNIYNSHGKWFLDFFNNFIYIADKSLLPVLHKLYDKNAFICCDLFVTHRDEFKKYMEFILYMMDVLKTHFNFDTDDDLPNFVNTYIEPYKNEKENFGYTVLCEKRLGGFILEYLTDIYISTFFPEDNILVSPLLIFADKYKRPK